MKETYFIKQGNVVTINYAYNDNGIIQRAVRKIKEIKKIDSKVINIQYPTVGYGKGLVPHFLTIYLTQILKKKEEFSSFFTS